MPTRDVGSDVDSGTVEPMWRVVAAQVRSAELLSVWRKEELSTCGQKVQVSVMRGKFWKSTTGSITYD